LVAAVDDEVAAGLGESQRATAPEAAAGRADDRLLAAQTEIHGASSPFQRRLCVRLGRPAQALLRSGCAGTRTHWRGRPMRTITSATPPRRRRRGGSEC